MKAACPAYIRAEGMRMRLVAFGGDKRMEGACAAAKKAGWETEHVREACGEIAPAQVVLLPWPRSFEDGALAGATEMKKEDVLGMLPRCDVLLAGGGVSAQEIVCAGRVCLPQEDEAFLRANAQLTAEGAVIAAAKRLGRALLGKTCLITGFGRIGQELAGRMLAMGVFVIVCARNEGQMRAAHRMGAHPVPLANLAAAAAQADVIMNTAPARLFDERALKAMRSGSVMLELASAPYGADPVLARDMGARMEILGGLPGKYAPLEAGAALFSAARRALERKEGENVDG